MRISFCWRLRASTLRLVALAAASLGFGVAGWACEPPVGRLVSAEAIVELRPAGRDGWVRIDGSLPQRWIARLIATDASGAPVVRDIPLDATNTGTLRFDASELRDPVLAIAGATEGTVNRAPYVIELVQP